VLTRPPKVTPEDERVALHGDAALVLCHERIGTAALAASNMFARTADGWKMIHHQAGPMAQQEQPPAARLH
ncbi:MAG TPA: nuclear transport factor 2 family protein, partial [Alphaproteobacteria bacterium]|nr:nuclear transport factor 2 family protein [Alphaproteobacteria bacterium]